MAADPAAASAVALAAGQRDTSRLEAFSDGIFAIAITLLVFQLRVPTHAIRIHGLWQGLGHEWPRFLAFVLSFVVIGLVWISNHDVFGHIGHVTHKLLVLNLGNLFAVASIPYPTLVLGQYLGTSHARDAIVLYSLWLCACGLIFNVPWAYLLTHRELFSTRLDDAVLRMVTVRFASAMVVYAAAAGAAYLSTTLALVLLALPVLMFVLPSPLSPATVK